MKKKQQLYDTPGLLEYYTTVNKKNKMAARRTAKKSGINKQLENRPKKKVQSTGMGAEHLFFLHAKTHSIQI